MTIYASKTEKGFFDSELTAPASLPADAVEISATLRDTLIAAQSADKVIDFSQVPPVAVDPASRLSLADVKAQKLAELETACAARITAGFTSSALGETYTYPAKPTDQSNLQASVLASILPGVDEKWTTPFWCADSEGKWAYQTHTAAQIQQVGLDGKNAINAAIAQKIVLEQKVEAAKTAPEVAAVVWSKDEVSA
ncbi:hypothetical protein ACFQDN_21405 [Pseudomonas asuensis]|uniref:DUF4376 domain-containing protein n=1 Tax=Pseudomonas asuensis TaxID=1825787 RepID=A0ABQ2H4X8_9PSED|nr:hypothetical protein [Pseudomonas asuensis]GGM31866.1 hypothetical protein GCM10009425_48050 [Pseudomonas asuensis]